MAANDVALEFLRRTMAGQSQEELRQFVTQALIDDGAGADEGWRIRTAADALQPHEPIEYLVDQLIPAPSLNIVYGGPGSLKSMILADLCVCVAGGIPWLPSRQGTENSLTFATKQAPTLWIDFDNGARRTDIRFGALLRSRGLGPETPCHYVSMPKPHLDASKDRHIEALGNLIRGGGYKLIVIDNLGLITGETEENSARMADIMGNLRRLTEETGCSIIIIHHQRKGTVNASELQNGTRRGDALRGNSAIEASLDLAILTERKEGEDSITLIATKVRDWIPQAVFGALFTYTHFDNSRDLCEARFFAQSTMSKEAAAAAMIQNVIKDIIQARPGCDQKTIVEEVRDRMAILTGVKQPGINKVRGTLKQMADDNAISTTGDSQNGIRYYP